MAQQGAVTAASGLHFLRGGAGSGQIGFVFFGFGGSKRINLLQICQSEWRFLRVVPGIIFVKIRQFRMTEGEFVNNQPHLQPPVAQVRIGNDLVAGKTVQAL